MSGKPSRRDLMKPVQLLGLAFVAAVFAGVVTLVSMGFFQSRVEGQAGHALMIGAVVAGITFIVTLVVIALLVLAVDPADVAKTVDRAVLLPKDDAAADAAPAAPDAPSAPAPPSTEDPASDDDPPRSDP